MVNNIFLISPDSFFIKPLNLVKVFFFSQQDHLIDGDFVGFS